MSIQSPISKPNTHTLDTAVKNDGGIACVGDIAVMPTSLFEFRHLGVNCANACEAYAATKAMAALFALEVRETPVSYFAGTNIEYMKSSGPGERGHIAFTVGDARKAEEYLAAHGVLLDMNTAVYDSMNRLRSVYIDKQISGFGIHLFYEYQ